MTKPKRRITDAVEILHRRYVTGRPEVEARLALERVNAEVAQAIYDLRILNGLTQRQLAAKIGTTASVICRLEDADYQGHSLAMLRRIAAALNSRLEVRMVPLAPRKRVQARKRLPV